MTVSLCAVPGCPKPAFRQTWCSMHYSRWHRHGDMDYGHAKNRVPLAARFWPKVDRWDPDACWIWTGSRDQHGYGQISRGGRNGGKAKAHRAAYELCVGPIPANLPEMDHLCRVSSCVNPKHLEPVTHAENMRRSKAAIATHCKRGHPYALSAARPGPTGRRLCWECVRYRSKLYWAETRRAASERKVA